MRNIVDMLIVIILSVYLSLHSIWSGLFFAIILTLFVIAYITIYKTLPNYRDVHKIPRKALIMLISWAAIPWIVLLICEVFVC